LCMEATFSNTALLATGATLWSFKCHSFLPHFSTGV
jgi:hypothetical protein